MVEVKSIIITVTTGFSMII